MSPGDYLNAELTEKTPVLGLRLWVVIGISVGVIIVLILCVLSIWVTSRRRTMTAFDKLPVTQIPDVSKEIAVDRVGGAHSLARTLQDRDAPFFSSSYNKFTEKSSRKMVLKWRDAADNTSQCSSVLRIDMAGSSNSGDDSSSGPARRTCSPYNTSFAVSAASPLFGMPEVSHLGWGHWFTLRDLEIATNGFSKDNILGEGGYGVVYRGRLMNGIEVAVKRLLLNNLGQTEKEFRVEVEASGHVRHKNLVRLLGYCIEGTHRMLVNEYVNNGSLEQWLHGALHHHGNLLSWENRVKVMLGTAKALAYLHEAIEPKVVHRDIKSSNILIDEEYNGKVSDFGLAKLLGSGKSHITTRVMGTFGYVAPEYANTGLLTEKSDVYSFGVLLLEAVTGRDPVDHSRPADEVNLVEWLKMMVGSRRTEEVVDPKMEVKPPTRSLKRVLLIALRCVDSDSDKRPNMGLVARMLEAEEDRRVRRDHAGQMESNNSSSSDLENKAAAAERFQAQQHHLSTSKKKKMGEEETANSLYRLM